MDSSIGSTSAWYHLGTKTENKASVVLGLQTAKNMIGLKTAENTSVWQNVTDSQMNMTPYGKYISLHSVT